MEQPYHTPYQHNRGFYIYYNFLTRISLLSSSSLRCVSGIENGSELIISTVGLRELSLCSDEISSSIASILSDSTLLSLLLSSFDSEEEGSLVEDNDIKAADDADEHVAIDDVDGVSNDDNILSYKRA